MIRNFRVEPGHIAMFARAAGEVNPVYFDEEEALRRPVGGIIAPPTFVQAGEHFDPDSTLRPRPGEPWLGSGATPSGTRSAGDANSSGENAGVLHAEQHFTYHRHLRPGDVLSATTRSGATWTKQGRRSGTLSFAETITEYRDQDGQLVVTARGVGVRTEFVIGSTEEES
jgi:acyl dehydratase